MGVFIKSQLLSAGTIFVGEYYNMADGTGDDNK